MSKSEHSIQNAIRLALSEAGILNFRVNVGTGWTGSRVSRTTLRGQPVAIIENPRPFSTGLPEGFSDILAAVQVEITPDMIGKTLAVFAVVEVKSSTGRATAQQKKFIETISNAGGLAGIARSADDAMKIVKP